MSELKTQIKLIGGTIGLRVGLFLYDHFKQYYTTDKMYDNIKTTQWAVEMYDSTELIAVGLVEDNQLTYSAVKESHRGNGLQMILIQERLNLLRDTMHCTTARMSIRHSNIASLKSALACGFKIMELTQYDDGEQGYLLTRQL